MLLSHVNVRVIDHTGFQPQSPRSDRDYDLMAIGGIDDPKRRRVGHSCSPRAP